MSQIHALAAHSHSISRVANPFSPETEHEIKMGGYSIPTPSADNLNFELRSGNDQCKCGFEPIIRTKAPGQPNLPLAARHGTPPPGRRER